MKTARSSIRKRSPAARWPRIPASRRSSAAWASSDLNLQPRPGAALRPRSAATAKSPGLEPRPRRSDHTRTRPGSGRLFAAASWAKTSPICPSRCADQREVPGVPPLATHRPPQVRIAIICNNFGPHPNTRVGAWAAANNTEIATPRPIRRGRAGSSHSSPRCAYFTLDGTDHAWR